MEYLLKDIISNKKLRKSLSKNIKFDDIIVGTYNKATYTHNIIEYGIWNGRYKTGERRSIRIKLFLYKDCYIKGFNNMINILIQKELQQYYDKSK